VLLVAGFGWERGFTGFQISLPFSFFGGGVAAATCAGLSSMMADFSLVMAGVSTNVTYFLAFIILSAASLA
jgi:hypothetical protein